jgi:hypothetical protein
MFCRNLGNLRIRRPNFVPCATGEVDVRWLKPLILSAGWWPLLATLIFIGTDGAVLCSQVTDSGSRRESHSDFPYQAKIKSKTGKIYSGPGLVHYATGELSTGEMVEVYRHDPGGWCAIRPPAKSFSLVPAAEIEELDDSLGKVLSADVQAWVGTELGPVETPLWQVKLKSGEQVELLGVVHWPDPEGFSTSWYQIAPPAGEFRWMRQEDLEIPPQLKSPAPSYHPSYHPSRPESREVARSGRPDDQPWAQAGSSHRDSAVTQPDFQEDWDGPARYAVASSDSDFSGGVSMVGYDHPMDQLQSGFSTHSNRNQPGNQSQGSSLGWRRATRSLEAENWAQPANSFSGNSFAQSPLENNPPFSSASSNSMERGFQPPDRFASSRMDSRSGLEQLIPMGSTINAPLTPRITELELKLNQEMLREPTQWRLSEIQSANQKILESSKDPGEQLQARQLMDKLENCRRIRDNSIKLMASRSGSTGSGLSGTDRGTGGIAAFNEDFSLATRYDAYGRLNQLIQESGKREATYVLQDETGKITHHVSPGPGMSLSSYVGKRVGIIGQRGYHTRLKLDHVTANTVVELKDR